MKKHVLCCIALLLASPLFATITIQQSTALWNQTSTTTCAPTFGTNTGAGNLIVVWTSWQSTSTFTASVQDTYPPPTGDTFVSAVGPTLQSAASTPTSAQIFYAKNIHGGADTVTVTYNGTGTVSSASCVIVEYSGADKSYPLDSVSAGYSTSGNQTTMLDSGTVAPANANLLVFAGGGADPNVAMTPGSGFTSLQSSHGTWGTGMVEDNTAAISGNNVLQRATECLGLSTCPPGTTLGNWIMQMAVFRDASWNVGAGWSPARPGVLVYADQFANLQAAINALPPTGGSVIIQPSTSEYACPTAIPSNVGLIGLVPSMSSGIIGSLTGFNVTNSQVTLGPCTTPPSIPTGAQNIRIANLTFDFDNNVGGLAFVDASGIDLERVSLVNAGKPCSPIPCTASAAIAGAAISFTTDGSGGNSSYNILDHVSVNCQVANCSAGLYLGANGGYAVTLNYFSDLWFTGVMQCGIELEAETDTNHFYSVHINPDGTQPSKSAPFCFNASPGSGSDIDADASYFDGVEVTSTTFANSFRAGQTSGNVFWDSGGIDFGSIANLGGTQTFSFLTEGMGPSGVNGMQVGSLNVLDSGNCTTSSHYCPHQTLSRVYQNTPLCFVTWNGTGTCTGILSCPFTSGGKYTPGYVVPTSSVSGDTCSLNWFVLGY